MGAFVCTQDEIDRVGSLFLGHFGCPTLLCDQFQIGIYLLNAFIDSLDPSLHNATISCIQHCRKRLVL